MKPTDQQQRVLSWYAARLGVPTVETKMVGADLYVRDGNPRLAWVIHPGENKAWPTAWPTDTTKEMQE